MMRRLLVTVLVAGSSFLPSLASAQGTKLWSVGRYDEMEKGSTDGVAIRSDGRLEAGPATSLLYATGKSYVWSMATDAGGNGYLGLGGTAAVGGARAPDYGHGRDHEEDPDGLGIFLRRLSRHRK